MTRPLPALACRAWARTYDRETLAADAVAAAIVTILLIPQSLAYALLAGLPPQAGLYASVAPLLVYAVFGSSRVLAVGPVAVVSLMTAAAIGGLPPALRADPQAAALVLVAVDCGLDFLGTIAEKDVGLAHHRADASHLEHQPLDHP